MGKKFSSFCLDPTQKRAVPYLNLRAFSMLRHEEAILQTAELR
jgi:hypothetical protein